MKKGTFFIGAFLAVALALSACGGDGTADPTVTAVPAEPTAAATVAPAEPTATATVAPADPTATAIATPSVSEPDEEPAASDEQLLAEYAKEHAGGPGAIFVGDPMQLIGPPPHEGMMFQASEEQFVQGSMAALFGVPELGIASHMFIFTSDYYRGLIEKARLTNPTELTSSGQSIEIQHVCISRTLPTCLLIQAYWAPNVERRTNGQVKLSVVSFPELGLAGPDTLDQVRNGTLDMVNIYAGYVAGALPALEVQALWGMASDWESSYLILTDVAPEVDQIILDATGGSPVLNRNWFAGADQWFFGNRPLQSVEDFEGMKIRTHGGAITDFITGMGAEGVFLGFGELYQALELDQIDAAATGILLAIPDRLYEVSSYMAGPVIGFGYTNNVINKDVWNKIPEDLQQILIEEGAKAELEALRLAPFQNIVALQIHQQLGVQPVPFSEEIVRHIRTVVFPEHVFPGWLRRLGYPERNQEIVDIANEKVSPYTGLWVEPDGSIRQVPITKGPFAQ